MSASEKPTVFISYSRKDKDWKNRFAKHFRVLEQDDQIDLWDDSRIEAGDNWREEISAAMDRAAVAVLLISSNFLTSDFILREEVVRLLQRRQGEGLKIYAVIVKSCSWKLVSWLKDMQVRPRDGKPLSDYKGNKRDQAVTEIVEEIHKILQSATVRPRSGGPIPPHPDDISIGRLPVTGSDLFGREEELKMLDEAWANRKTNVISFVASGGVGKSALINYWLQKMAKDGYRGADKVYGWSFYSQGTSDKAASAEFFIDAALRWFGDSDPTKGSPWDKGERLAKLIRSQRTLLILDGLEPLQYPPGYEEGKLREQSLQALLKSLAADNSGLCIISTRIKVADFANFEGSTVRHIDLDYLTPEAGAQLLRALDVNGTDAELKQAANEFAGHSLALTLLGSYLTDVCDGDIRRRNEIGPLVEDVRRGGHAKRVMLSYERWFGEGPELAVLRMLGLFNRPADKDAIATLREPPAIPSLTDSLQVLSEVQWQQVLGKLRRAELLAKKSDSHTEALDTHPLVREHFSRQLKESHPSAWREANGRLFEHYKGRAKYYPDTIEEMSPLYSAIAHGCEAGRYEEALTNIFSLRVERGRVLFSTHTLGAIESNLAALTKFFNGSWNNPVAELDEQGQAYVLSNAGFGLRAIGRLREAVGPLKTSLETTITHKDWLNATRTAINLSQLFSIMGDLIMALEYANQSLEHASRGSEIGVIIFAKTTLADVLHQMGRLTEAKAIFFEAEQLEKKHDPKEVWLYGFQGHLYCDLLLSYQKYKQVRARALKGIEIAKGNNKLTTLGLDYISLGRACLVQSRQEHSRDFSQSINHFYQAIKTLRQAGLLDFLVRGLIARSEMYLITGSLGKAKDDLDEAMSIVIRSGMRLYETDCHLGYARLYVAQENHAEARGHLEKAKQMIDEMGYHRRDDDLAEIEALLGKASS